MALAKKIGGLIIIKFGQFLKRQNIGVFWEKNMKILELVKNLFRYPVDMEEKIIQHEEKMLKVYTQIIDESYRGFFEKFGFTVDIFLHWDNMLKKHRLKIE